MRKERSIKYAREVPASRGLRVINNVIIHLRLLKSEEESRRERISIYSYSKELFSGEIHRVIFWRDAVNFVISRELQGTTMRFLIAQNT